MSKFLVIVTDKYTLHETTYYDVKDIVETKAELQTVEFTVVEKNGDVHHFPSAGFSYVVYSQVTGDENE